MRHDAAASLQRYRACCPHIGRWPTNAEMPVDRQGSGSRLPLGYRLVRRRYQSG
jgi:hypothetical protein